MKWGVAPIRPTATLTADMTVGVTWRSRTPCRAATSRQRAAAKSNDSPLATPSNVDSTTNRIQWVSLRSRSGLLSATAPPANPPSSVASSRSSPAYARRARRLARRIGGLSG